MRESVQTALNAPSECNIALWKAFHVTGLSVIVGKKKEEGREGNTFQYIERDRSEDGGYVGYVFMKYLGLYICKNTY